MTNWLMALDELAAEIPILIDAANDSEKKVICDLQIEIVDGAVFPLHRFKGEHLPKPTITDLAWLHWRLSSLSKNGRIDMASQYSDLYQQEYEIEPVGHRKDGKARYEANIWLLEHTHLKVESSAYEVVTKLTKQY